MVNTIRTRARRPFIALAAALLIVRPATAQTSAPTQPPAALTAADYARAERFMNYNVNPLVLHAGVRARWISGDRFWYRTQTENGAEFILVDAAAGTRTPAFDQAAVAS